MGVSWRMFEGGQWARMKRQGMERSGHGLLSASQAGWSLADLCLWGQAQLEPL